MSWRCISRMGHVGELHFAVIAGELTSRETVWGVVKPLNRTQWGL